MDESIHPINLLAAVLCCCIKSWPGSSFLIVEAHCLNLDNIFFRGTRELTIIGCGPPWGDAEVSTVPMLRCIGGGHALTVGRADASSTENVTNAANSDSSGVWKSVTMAGLSISGCGGMGCGVVHVLI